MALTNKRKWGGQAAQVPDIDQSEKPIHTSQAFFETGLVLPKFSVWWTENRRRRPGRVFVFFFQKNFAGGRQTVLYG